MRFKLFVLGFLFHGLVLFAGTLNLDSRFDIQNTGKDLASYSALIEPTPLGNIHFKGGVRFSHSVKDIEAFNYGAEFSYSLFSFFESAFRLTTDNLLNTTAAQTHLLILGSFTFHPFDSLTLFFSGGWYKRFVKLNQPYLLPSLINPSYTEHDFALNFGTKIRWNQKLSTQFNVATFEELSVYNLNNPFIQGLVSFSPNSDTTVWSLYTRYRLLLGFGRIDSLTLGLNYSVIL